MNRLSGFVSLHPYFKVPPDKMPHLKAILPEFAAKTRNETGNLFYEFTINGDEVFCREGLRQRGGTARTPGQCERHARPGPNHGGVGPDRGSRTSRGARRN